MTAQKIQAELQKWKAIGDNLRKAISALQEVPENGGIEIGILSARYAQARDNERLAYEALQVAQKKCEHTWVDDGRDSHYDWEKCTKCGETQRC